jgi:hypothetical protein
MGNPFKMPRPQKGDEGKVAPSTGTDLFRERLYGELTTPEAAAEALKEKQSKQKKGGFFGHENFYFWLYSFTQKHFVKKKKEGFVTPEEEDKGKKKKKKKPIISKGHQEAIDFMGWEVDPRVIASVPLAAGVLGLVIGLLIAGIGAFFVLTPPAVAEPFCGDGICQELAGETRTNCPEDCVERGSRSVVYDKSAPGVNPIFLIILMTVPLILFVLMFFYALKYPINAAESEKMRALTYVPEIMNYLIMKMRLQPNLETAVEFASEHGEGRIAEEFRELLWRTKIGQFSSVEEGLDDMAYRWEPYSEDFKHAITLIRASVLIPNDAERNALYDKTLDDLLGSTKEKMEKYARSMKQPSMYLFYIAILLPLMMLIMLPVAAAFAKQAIATKEVLILLYVIAFPMATYLYARSILGKRPGGYVPPLISDDHPELPKKGTTFVAGMKLPVVPIAIFLLVAIIVGGYFLEESIQYSEQYLSDQKEIYGRDLEQPVLMQFYIPLAIAGSVGFYLYGRSVDKKRIQDKIIRMEDDFKDSMYLMASRLGEKKPLEDCLGYVRRFMPESKVATELFENIQRNIMVLGLTLRTAIFDPVYGAMRNTPSRLMNSAFKIMVDSIELGPEVASYSLMAVSEQIRNVQKINDLMRKLLDEVTSMMSSMATFIGPVILGMIASLQEVIVGVVPESSESGASSSMGGFLGGGSEQVSIKELMASTLEFQFIIAIYIFLLAIILSYFTGKVKYGNDRNAIFLLMGKTLPIAVIVFSFAILAGQMLMGGLK